MPLKVLILGGTTEAYRLAEALVGLTGVQVITSLAGRTSAPRMPSGDTRIGGFGGVAGLTSFLRAEGVGAVIDATHPFAVGMGWNALAGCHAAAVPLLRLERPAWIPEPGDHWTLVEDWGKQLPPCNVMGRAERCWRLAARSSSRLSGSRASGF